MKSKVAAGHTFAILVDFVCVGFIVILYVHSATKSIAHCVYCVPTYTITHGVSTISTLESKELPMSKLFPVMVIEILADTGILTGKNPWISTSCVAYSFIMHENKLHMYAYIYTSILKNSTRVGTIVDR